MNTWKRLLRRHIIIAGLLLGAFTHPAQADCTFKNPDADPRIMFTMPAQIIVEPDVAVGTILYSGDVVGTTPGLSCTGGVQVREGYTSLSDADYSGVLEGVYKTSVPGIGFRAARATNTTAAFTRSNIITPWHYVGTTGNWDSYDSDYRVAVELVVIGPVQSGTLETSQFNADYQMGSLTVSEIRFTPSRVNVVVNTCNLVSKNINVLLDTISTGGVSGGYSDVLTDSGFKIEVANCAIGSRIDYQFSSSGSTGVTDGNILNIAKGDNAASGVGIQVLDKDNNVLTFDRDYTGIESAAGQGEEAIPLKARYVKTGTVKGGVVNAVATFEVFYR